LAKKSLTGKKLFQPTLKKNPSAKKCVMCFCVKVVDLSSEDTTSAMPDCVFILLREKRLRNFGGKKVDDENFATLEKMAGNVDLPDVDRMLGRQVDVVRLEVLLVVLVVPSLLQGRKLLLNAARGATETSIVGNLRSM
jgi:hypothetical protein